jgi:hypothetical protein
LAAYDATIMLLERRVALDHLVHIVGEREDAAAGEEGVEMRGVGGEHHVAAPRLHANAQNFRAVPLYALTSLTPATG